MALVDTSKSDRLEHPEEPGQWIEVRHLLGVEMDEAQEVRVKKLLNVWGDALNSASTGTPQDRNSLEARMQRYDHQTLLNYAITGWSYDAPVDPDNIARLDNVTRQWLVEEIIVRNTRPAGKSNNGVANLSLVESPSS